MSEIRIKVPYNPDWDNRPAHQVTNGQFVDIPTHHFLNGRWQGELTSQSPLKFWADGEMFDWRVEGRTSENLFDKKDTISNAVLDAGEIATAKDAGGFLIYAKVQPGQTYSFSTSDFVRLGLRSSCTIQKPVIGTSYIIDGENTHINHGEVKNFIRTIPNNANWLVIQLRDAANLENDNMLIEGSHQYSEFPSYEPYGGVGDWSETEQKYKIPVTVEGNNLFDGEWKQGTIASPSSLNRVSNKNVIRLKPNTIYTLGVRGSSIVQYALIYRDKVGNVTYNSGWVSMDSPVLSPTSDGATAEILLSRSDTGSITPVSEEILSLKVIFVEGTYTASTLPPYEVNLYTDHQLMNGDSIDYTTTETQIPIATGNNILTVDTAVQPSKVFVKFEG